MTIGCHQAGLYGSYARCMADPVQIDLDDLTLGEMEEVEQIVGVPFGEAFEDTTLSAKALLALVYVVKRRENPNFTLDQARNFRLSDLQVSMGGEPV